MNAALLGMGQSAGFECSNLDVYVQSLSTEVKGPVPCYCTTFWPLLMSKSLFYKIGSL